MTRILLTALVSLSVFGPGCKEEDSATTGGAGAAPSGAPSATSSGTAAAPQGAHNRIPIGEKTVGNLKLVATMDEPVKPGGEGAFDVVITGGKPKAVRFWVGTEDAKGSAKAKAEEETTDNWHTHAEVPDPLPAGSQFWVEVEPPAGDEFTASFDLKQQ
jgi:hypothetical protein